jgi:transcriptional regulator with XRE-family HTH domain
VSLGKKIKELRYLRGWTQEELAEAAQLRRGHIARLERNNYKRPTGDTFMKLAKALRIHPSELFYAAGYDINDVCTSGELVGKLDPDIFVFFQDDWPALTDEERALVRRILRVVKEGKDERVKKTKKI